jgi:RNA polymerase sigma-70 factor, ECF subfamily
VLRVIYLVFNEGYAATSGSTVTRQDLSSEAIRLGRLLVELLPEPEALGLLALMLLHESRRAARTTPEGDLVLLEEQDRRAWNHSLIGEGLRLVERALQGRPTGPYAIQAAIAAVHAQAPSTGETDWSEIIGLYDALFALDPSPVIELNRAVALSMLRGPEAGLASVREILDRGDLKSYALAHAAAADFYRRLNRKKESRAAYERALALTRQEPERRFLQKRITELE